MKIAVVLGSAPGALEELARVPFTHDVIAVNQAGIRYLDRIVAWGSLHANELEGWLLEREAQGGSLTGVQIFTHGSMKHRPDIQIIPSIWQGSSGLFAVQWAITVAKYDRVVLCGVHMGGNTRRDADGVIRKAPMDYDFYRGGWRRAAVKLKGRVASMGGWTQEMLGQPDNEFWEDGKP